MNPSWTFPAFWSFLVTILVVDGFTPLSSSPMRRGPTRLHSATQTYLDSLSGFGTTAVPPLQSFVETAATLTDDFSIAATTLLAETSVDVPDTAGMSPDIVLSDPPIPQVDNVLAAVADSSTAESTTTDAIPNSNELWSLGSTVFESVPEASATTKAVVGRTAQDTLTDYWDTVVLKTIPSWYEATKAKQEEFVAAVLAQQQKTQAAKSLLPKTQTNSNPLENMGDAFSGLSNPFKGIEVPTFSKLADASLADIFSAMGRTLGTIARGFWYVLTAIVEFLSGGKSSLNEMATQLRISIDESMHNALDTIRSSLYDLGQVTLQEAATFLLQIVIKFVELMFQLVSSLCQAFTGRGLDVWLERIGSGLTEQAVVATSALSTSVHDLSHASLAELAAILGSYGAAVAKVLIDSPRSLAEAFSSSGATELLQNTLSSTAVESTTSLLGSGNFPY